MNTFSRRDFIRLLGVSGTASTLGMLGWPLELLAKANSPGGRVVIVGGGFGGATCAKYIRKLAPIVHVTLIERDMQFVTCPFSNMVIGGINEMKKITHSYDRLRNTHGVEVVHDTVIAVDAVKDKVTLKSGKTLRYDRLVVSPGIDFKWNEIEGYDEATSQQIPHAWKGGPQTVLLAKQLKAMKDGGLVVIAPPDNPFRCPPGPYERASMIAHYLKTHKPKSKILILDAKEKFSKQPLFMQGWQQRYPGMIEWVKGSDGGRIDRVDVKNRIVFNEVGTAFKADVINIIPAQKAGAIAHSTGLTGGKDWCAVDQKTFASAVHNNVHVIGDASIAGKMPKSGFAANSQGKVCAAAVVTSLSGVKMPEPSYVNTCYSLVAPDYGISVAAVYRLSDKGIVGVKGAGGVSPKDADAAFRQREADYARGWYASITSDVFG